VETCKRDKPADQDQRDLILNDLNTTMLVEAAAGTGKTTSMVGRMVNLLSEGRCTLDTLAAVTFTRKAAAELRTRFQVDLERAYRDAKQPARGRLAQALSAMDRCFIGTIHSFCGRLLRERPVEASVDVAFREIDEVEDKLLRKQAWSHYVAGLYAGGHAILPELEELGLEIGSLEESFTRFADYPDVQEWPAAVVDLPDLDPARQALETLVHHMEDVTPTLPENPGNDLLMPKYRVIPLMWRQALPDHVPDLMDILTQFKALKVVQKNWPFGKQQALQELERWDTFRTDYAEPLVGLWREKRYEPTLRALKPAKELYDRLRKDAAVLNYQDLLMTAAALLRDKPRIREYFRKRFTHVLVDEFQDTDPIQAEVMMLLTADDHEQNNWRDCRPVPGSLFVVGDPKQSIYRFRRADIVTYNQVRDIILQSKGKVVNLAVNFRTTRPLVDWVNAEFDERFPPQSSDYSPQYVSLIPAAGDGSQPAVSGVRCLLVPEAYGKNEEANEYDADLVARTIRSALPAAPPERGSVALHPGHFMIVTPGRDKLALYGDKLEQLGVPHQVTGGKALSRLTELGLVRVCLNAVVHPDDPVALVAALRSELFGFSDVDLFRFKRQGGVFCYFSELPAGLEPETAALFRDAFERFRQYAHWCARMPMVPAVENMVADLGLSVRAAAATGGNVQAGSFAKVLELLRADETSMWSPAQLVERLEELTEQTEDFDGMPCREDDSTRVRVMNLHKVKGLEAPVVFLADPTGVSRHPVDLHVDRSGDRVRGYMRITGRVAGRTREDLLALPPQWATYEEKEARFQEAEKIRLMYVAATRAGKRLVISQREKGQHHNPWKFFEKSVADAPALPVPCPQEPMFREEVDITESDVARVVAETPVRWAAAMSPTYRTAAAKTVALGTEGTTLRSGGEHGTEWGTVIHTLLQAAMIDRDASLIALAQDALSEQGLETDLAQDAVDTVHSVMASDIWQRATAAEQVLVEVPFETLLSESGSATGGSPFLVRGAIDLAFREPAGWVIVDYKTDRVAAARVDGLIAKYRPQVRLYCQAWQLITGQAVHESGLYFTHSRVYSEVT
jgi:ATP-dependent helicase/nuclease subunit A